MSSLDMTAAKPMHLIVSSRENAIVAYDLNTHGNIYVSNVTL